MKKEIHEFIYTCDVCKKVVDGKLNEVKLPHQHMCSTDYQGFGRWDKKLHYSTIEICNDCAIKLNDLIKKRFALIYSEDYCDVLIIEEVKKRKKNEISKRNV